MKTKINKKSIELKDPITDEERNNAYETRLQKMNLSDPNSMANMQKYNEQLIRNIKRQHFLDARAVANPTQSKVDLKSMSKEDREKLFHETLTSSTPKLSDLKII